MPWVKDFNENIVVGHAMKVFWAKGYEATSMTDLVEMVASSSRKAELLIAQTNNGPRE